MVSELPVQTIPYGAGFYDTSEYMIGDVAVGIILLESNGGIDPNSEDWTPAEESNVVSEIQAGLNWWAAREPNAKLTFIYDIHYKVPTRYEPITRTGYHEFPPGSQSGESLWIPEAMSYLGFSSYTNRWMNNLDYDNYIRITYSTDWAYTIFVVDSSNDADGAFLNAGYAAYAYVGGPYLVVTSTNDGYGINNLDAVISHETAHIFYALDQYYDPSRLCTEKSGYLNVENQNSLGNTPCAINVPSIMKDGIVAYPIGAVDTYARQQLGWRDTDDDNILDIIDFPPVSTLNTFSPDPTDRVAADARTRARQIWPPCSFARGGSCPPRQPSWTDRSRSPP